MGERRWVEVEEGGCGLVADTLEVIMQSIKELQALLHLLITVERLVLEEGHLLAMVGKEEAAPVEQLVEISMSLVEVAPAAVVTTLATKAAAAAAGLRRAWIVTRGIILTTMVALEAPVTVVGRVVTVLQAEVPVAI